MTATAVLAASMTGILVLLAAITWQLVLTLRQARRTAQAMEELLVSARPRIESIGDRVHSVLDRTDRILDKAESAQTRFGGYAEYIGPAFALMKNAAAAASVAATIASGLAALWRNLRGGDSEAGPQPRKGELDHE